jgi:hypothetical protein
MKEKKPFITYATPFAADIVMGSVLCYEKWILLYTKLLIKALPGVGEGKATSKVEREKRLSASCFIKAISLQPLKKARRRVQRV